MGKSEIIEIIKSNKPEIETRYGVQRLELFGSFVKERQKKKSDVDILVTFNRNIDLFEFLELREFLEKRAQKLIWLWKQPSSQPLESVFWQRLNMSSKGRDIADYLDDTANAIYEAEEFTRNMNYETFASDRRWKRSKSVSRPLR